ncbi:MAG: MFS transporter [Actinomycetota bacterium]|nr:MFS transporter [Actinomycetota bacterium]
MASLTSGQGAPRPRPGPARRGDRPGRAIAAFGLVSWLPAGLLLLPAAGAADAISAVFGSTTLQLRVPDRLRGRLSAVPIVVVTGGPRLGDREAGAVAAITSARFAVLCGGLACMAGVGLIAALIPELGPVTARDEEIDEVEARAPGPWQRGDLRAR